LIADYADFADYLTGMKEISHPDGFPAGRDEHMRRWGGFRAGLGVWADG